MIIISDVSLKKMIYKFSEKVKFIYRRYHYVVICIIFYLGLDQIDDRDISILNPFVIHSDCYNGTIPIFIGIV